MRYAIVSTVFVITALSTLAQTPAIPPDRLTLERLQLRTDWTANIPVANSQDGIVRVQIADQGQVFVQTKAGILVALDSNTGRTLWKYKYPNNHASGFPIAWNDSHVFAINVAKLFCFDRFRGSLEFEYVMNGSPMTGPIADSENIYLPQSGMKVQAYKIPRELMARREVAEVRPGALAGVAGTGLDKSVNLADSIADRYAGHLYPAKPRTEIDRFNVPKAYRDRHSEGNANNRTPSIVMLQSVVPPYSSGNLNSTPSITSLPSVKQPYTLYPEHTKYNQATPSIQMMSTLARYSEQASLRPRPIEPSPAWTYATHARVHREPILAQGLGGEGEGLIWVVQDGDRFAAVSSSGGTRQASTFEGRTVSPLAGPYNYAKELLGFIALSDGRLLAVDMLNFAEDHPRYEWIAKVGGYMNHKPMADKDSVYASGDHSGINCIDVKTGELTWRTEDSIDRILAINEGYVFARDREDKMHIYQKGKLYEASRKIAKPIASMNIAGFNVIVANDLTDRIYLVSESGLIVVLHQNAAKYNRAVRIAPPSMLPAPKKDPMPKDPNMPMTMTETK